MERNPYAPPTAEVADVANLDAPTTIDRYVSRACQLMWWSFGIGAILQIWTFAQLMRTSVPAAILGAVFGLGIGFGVTWWVAAKLKAGRNWMRLLMTTLAVLGLLCIPLFPDVYRRTFTLYLANPPQAIAALVQWPISLLTIVFINMPSARAWFRDMKRAR